MSRSLRVGLVGYGRMGKEVEAILSERGHQVVWRVDPTPGPGCIAALELGALESVDGVIEFSLPAGVVSNARLYAEAKTAAVVGTTGWEAQRAEVRQIIEGSQAGYVYGSNYSIGAHIFFRVASAAARLIAKIPEYDIMVHEYHHKLKADSPSGTALSVAKEILKQVPRKTTVQPETLDRPIKPEELHVSSTRGGSIPGIHRVFLDSPADSIELVHTARNRQGFAFGSVLALEWLVGRQGFMEVDVFVADLLDKA